MRIFERLFRPEVKKEIPPEEAKPQEPQLMRIFSDLQKSPEVFDLVTKQIYEQAPGRFTSHEEVKRFFSNIGEGEGRTGSLSVAKLVESTLGQGTLRKLAFVSSSVDAPKNLLKMLKKDFEKLSFEKQAEKGLYLFVKETYGISWDIEKTSRDAWQNFFDANKGTIDGVNFETAKEEFNGQEAWRVKISGDKGYDWRRLVHVGASEKESPEAVGGFGEGTKYLALIMLRDFGAKEVKYSGNDWSLNFYLDELPRGSYEREGYRGIWVRKKKRETAQGNSLEIVFAGEGAKEKAETMCQAKELFYSSENPDFKVANFDNRETGGFKILPPIEKGEYHKYEERQNGHFYHLGQRTHHESRDKWETVRNMNIWVWQRVLPLDRDRGMITNSELEGKVIPLIVDSMKPEEMEKCIYDFKPLWDKGRFYEESSKVLERMAKRLAKAGTKLQFEEEYLASDTLPWINRLWEQQNYKICPGFMADIGMKRASDKFKELQEHYRVEASPEEVRKIELLQKVAEEIGLDQDEIKEAWIFSGADEKSIFSGQYNDLFYWMSRESFGQNFLDALNIYVHEAAHKKGPHGDPQFEYRLDELKGKIQKFILERGEEFKATSKEWEEFSRQK